MARQDKDVQRRLNLLFDLWNDILNKWERGERLTREDVVAILKREYEREKISPLRGAALPEDIYDKEMASLYVVGKYGMGLDEQYPDLFDSVFYVESRYDKIAEILLSTSPQEARDKILALVGGHLSDNTIARILRIKFTSVYFGFDSEESLKRLAEALAEAFPEKRDIVAKYIRFYIAFKVASEIYRGHVRDRLTKEALKQGTALTFSSFKGTIPDDSYIKRIARGVFGVPQRVLDRVMPSHGRERRQGRRGRRQ